jgi:Domain of unknown function (DUF1772)
MLAGQIALIVAAAFASAAFYINLAEHPARMMLPAKAAVRQWAPSYKAGFAMQATLAIVGGLSALVQWYIGGGMLWLSGALLLLANWPFTLLVIMPTNRRLLDSEALPEADVKDLLQRWNQLHSVRTGLGTGSAAAMLLASLR